MSKYSVPVGNNGRGGSSENIKPMSPDEAMRWLEDHDGAEAIERYFAGEIEDA